MNRICSLLALSIFSLLIFSCRKHVIETTPSKGGGSTSPLNQISQVQNGNYVTSIAYNSDTTVKAIYYIDNSSNTRDSILFFYQDKKLVKAEEPGYRFVYLYEGKHVSTINFSDRNDHVYHQYKFRYAGDDIIEIITDIQQNGVLQPYEKNLYTYSTPGNEITSENFGYENGNWIKAGEKRTTLRDNHLNYSFWLDTYPFLLSTRNRGNNPLREEYWDENGVLWQVKEYTYSYDALGKPVSITLSTKNTGAPAVVSTSVLSYK